MEILKTGLKLAGSAALGTVGLASTLLRQLAYATGSDEVAALVGGIQDASFEAIHDMWTPEEERTDAYYEAKGERAMCRAESAARAGEKVRREYERRKKGSEE